MGFTFLFICLFLFYLSTFDAVAPSYLKLIIMKTIAENGIKYETPQVEIIEVEVEKGFSNSFELGDSEEGD